MDNTKIIGIDIAKNVFQIYGTDSKGKKVISKRISRAKLAETVAQFPRCLIGMEACGSSNYWGRKFSKMGHTVKLMSPQFVKPYVKTNKNDYNDAEAICEAVSRVNMRFVPIKTVRQQNIQILHKIRTRLVKDKVALGNQIRGLLMEYGVILPQGDSYIRKMSVYIDSSNGNDLTEEAKYIFAELHSEFLEVESKILNYTQQIALFARDDEQSKNLMSIPGIGEITATAMIASIGDFKSFRNGRDLSAWIGLVPKQRSSGNKKVLLGISKRGDKYLRTLLIQGAKTVVNNIRDKLDQNSLWVKKLLARNGTNKTVVALANKNARIAWSVVTKNTLYSDSHMHCYGE